MKQKNSTTNGFTFIELLVVITTIAILAAVVLLIVKPTELVKQGRDHQRVFDLADLERAITAVTAESGSIPTILCANTTSPCSGDSRPETPANKYPNGTGWVKVNLSQQKVFTSPVLPVDPLNNEIYHYTYSTNATGDKWEINAKFESQKYSDEMKSDGGNADDKYEVGTDPTIQ